MSKKKVLATEDAPNHIKRLPPKEPDTTPQLNLVDVLELHSFSGEQLELGLREFRIKGIDQLLTHVKQSLKKKEEKDALNKYLRMCPPIEKLTAHILEEHPQSKEWFAVYNEKLKQKIPNLQR